jgi:glycine cleavage system regulatory protein
MRKLGFLFLFLLACSHERPRAAMNVVVKDTPGTIATLTLAAESVGGYVSETKVWREGESTNAVMTLRVPADKIASTVALVRAMSERVQAESMRYKPADE